MSRHSGVDPFLSHLPDVPAASPESSPRPKLVMRGFTKVAAPSTDSLGDWYPVLVRLPNADFQIPPSISQFKENSRMGNVLSGRGSKLALEALGALPGVSIEVSRDGGTWELDTSLPTVKGNDVNAPESETAETQCIVAIIDCSIDPMHEAFLDRNRQTRLLYVWDQTATNAPPPSQSKFSFDYGAFYTKADITQTLAKDTPLTIAPQASEREKIHGTHVASIAAGRRTLGADGKPIFAGGMAPDAPLVVVIPALRSGKRPSEGFAKSHIDALKLIEEIAQRHQLPVVVNLSAGIAAGAHDGSSTLEAGFDAFTNGGHAAGRAIVKSAGNMREAKRYRRFNVTNGGGVKIELAPPPLGGAGRATLEAWFSSADELELTLKEKDRAPSCTLTARNQLGKVELHRGLATLSYRRFHHDNGDSQVLVSLPQTQLGFELTFVGTAIRGEGTIDVWIEGELTLADPSPERTLTVPGSARTVITVASSERDGKLMAGSSSRGPTRDGRNKPELFAPGVEIRAAKAGSRVDVIAQSGTSMAAPHVAGAIALCFSQQARLQRDIPNALQVRGALIATASGMNGSWQKDRGFGLLNVQGFLKAFDEPEATPPQPAEPST